MSGAWANVRAEDGWQLMGLFDPGVLAALGGALIAVLAVLWVTAWLVMRRVRRSAVLARGRELTVQGAAMLNAYRLPPGTARDAAQLHQELLRARSLFRRQLASAQRSGAYLGEVPALLPSLEAEGDRLQQRLRQSALAPADGDGIGRAELTAQARHHLEMLDALRTAMASAALLPPAPGQLAAEVGDAVSGLRAYSAAYRELTETPPAGPAPAPPGHAQPPQEAEQGRGTG